MLSPSFMKGIIAMFDNISTIDNTTISTDKIDNQIVNYSLNWISGMSNSMLREDLKYDTTLIDTGEEDEFGRTIYKSKTTAYSPLIWYNYFESFLPEYLV